MQHLFEELQSHLNSGDHQAALEMILNIEKLGEIPHNMESIKYQLSWNLGEYDLALQSARRLIELEPDNASTFRLRNHILLNKCHARASIDDFMDDVDVKSSGKKFVMSAMPKSGSTFLAHSIAKLHDLSIFAYFLRGDESEQELNLFIMAGTITLPSSTQQHFRATETNIQLLQAFNIEPVVLSRNIFDALVSMADMVEKTHLPVAFFQDWIADVGREKCLEAVVCKWTHWYIEYYVSWQRVIRQKRLSPLLLYYEDVMKDKIGTLQQITKHCGLEQKTTGEIEEAIRATEDDKETSRINVGRSGRGREQLSQSQIDFIDRIADVYRGQYDLSPIGL